MGHFDSVLYAVVGGIKTACLSRKDIVELMVRDCPQRRELAKPPALVFDNNGQGISLASTNSEFASSLSEADIIHADGMPVVVASRFLPGSFRIPERSATTDLIHDMAEAASQAGLSFFLLGGEEEVNRKCAESLQAKYPELRIAGRRNGYFSFEEEARVCEEISKTQPDVIWVGLGKPKEQSFCVRNKDRLTAGWLVTCGGCFNFVTGDYSRAPVWMQNYGMEWLYRMLTNPRKLVWRYLVTSPHALYLLLTRTYSLHAENDSEA